MKLFLFYRNTFPTYLSNAMKNKTKTTTETRERRNEQRRARNVGFFLHSEKKSTRQNKSGIEGEEGVKRTFVTKKATQEGEKTDYITEKSNKRKNTSSLRVETDYAMRGNKGWGLGCSSVTTRKKNTDNNRQRRPGIPNDKLFDNQRERVAGNLQTST
jgi:hypothetical protein